MGTSRVATRKGGKQHKTPLHKSQSNNCISNYIIQPLAASSPYKQTNSTPKEPQNSETDSREGPRGQGNQTCMHQSYKLQNTAPINHGNAAPASGPERQGNGSCTVDSSLIKMLPMHHHGLYRFQQTKGVSTLSGEKRPRDCCNRGEAGHVKYMCHHAHAFSAMLYLWQERVQGQILLISLGGRRCRPCHKVYRCPGDTSVV